MEERLFWIGIVMGGYAWASRRWQRTGALDTRLKAGLWHALFCAIAGFSVTMIVVMSFESRARFISIAAHAVSAGEFYPSLAVALLAGLGGFARAYLGGAKTEARKHRLGEDLEWADTVFSAVLLASVLMYFVVQAFKIPSGSMRQTLLEGDHLFVNKFIYGLRVPLTGKRVFSLRPVQRGDVVVFRFPSDDPQEMHCGSQQYGKDFIKRVVGLPGDVIQVEDGRVILNGKRLDAEPYAQYIDPRRQPRALLDAGVSPGRYQELWQGRGLDNELKDVLRDYFGPVTVPPGSYFAMGDNRDSSCDSRYWGPVGAKYMKGKAWFIYWPPSRMRIVK